MAVFDLASAADLYNPAIQKMFIKSAKLDQQNYQKYYAVESGVTDYDLIDSSISGLGEAARIVENAVIVSEKPVQGYDKTYRQVEYGKVLAFTKKMWKFGIKKRDMTTIVNELRMACVRKRERDLADKLDNGWSTSYSATDDSGSYTRTISGGNGVAFFSASQTREDGGANNNNIIYDGTTYNMTLEYPGLKAALRTAQLIRDPKGNPMNIDLDSIVVAKNSANHMRIMEIQGGNGRIPGSNDNDGSAIGKLNVIALPYLDNTDYWFMFDSNMKNYQYGLQYKESQPIQLEGPNLVFKTGEMQYKSTIMYDFGHNDFRGWVGSTSAEA
jgi:hypothetical protein